MYTVVLTRDLLATCQEIIPKDGLVKGRPQSVLLIVTNSELF